MTMRQASRTGRGLEQRRRWVPPSRELTAEEQAWLDREVGEPQACGHERTELRLMTKSNNTTEVRWQCVYCGAERGVVKKQSVPPAQLASLPAWEPDRQTEWYRARGALRQNRYQAREALRQQLLNGKRAQWNQWYANYLDSPEWREKRRSVIARAAQLCEGCRLVPASEVHHTTYEHVGDELLFELVALCEDCHQRVHGHPDTRPPFDED